MKLGNIIDMLSRYETYCDFRDLTIGKKDVIYQIVQRAR